MDQSPLHLDLRHEEIPCQMRHLLVMTAWDQLAPGHHFEIVIDHDLAPLHRQLVRAGKSKLEWTSLRADPVHHHIRIRRRPDGLRISRTPRE